MWKTAAIEGVEVFARASAGRFLAKILCDPCRAGVAKFTDPKLLSNGFLLLGGSC